MTIHWRKCDIDERGSSGSEKAATFAIVGVLRLLKRAFSEYSEMG